MADYSHCRNAATTGRMEPTSSREGDWTVMEVRPQDAPPDARESDVVSSETEAEVSRVYLALVRQSKPSRSLLLGQGFDAETVDRAIAILAARGLVARGGEGELEVTPPDIALPAHAAELERRARTARTTASELAQIYFEARADTHRPIEGLRILQSVEEIAAATAEIVGGATRTVRAARNLSPRTRQLFALPMETHREKLYAADGSLLVGRTSYDVEVLELPHAAEVLAARAEGGERARFSHELPFSAVVVDDTVAVVDLSSFDETGYGSLLVRLRPTVLALVATLDAIWRLGTPLARVQDSELDPRDVQVLSLLAAGVSDVTIARQTGISQRTVERRVRALMDRLGANTRFQAGVQAARRGWI